MEYDYFCDSLHTLLRCAQEQELELLTNKEHLRIATDLYHTTVMFHRHDDEGVIMPFVFWILYISAAACAKSNCLKVVNEPNICPAYPEKDKLMSSLFELVRTQGILDSEKHLRVLIEVKGTERYPCDLRGNCASQNVAQLFQQVALSYASGLWHTALLCGLVTTFEWNLFVIESVSDKMGPLKLRVTEFRTFTIDETRLEESMSLLGSYIVNYLDTVTQN